MIILPIPPSVNALYAISCTGHFPRIYKTKEGKDWIEEAGYKLKSQWRGQKMIELPCKLIVRAYTSRMNRDCDNFMKATQDILQDMGVIKNDSLIYKLDVEKFKCKKEEERIELDIVDYSQ